jgi:uncharacterized RDD family membrane protein YckC
MAKIPNANKYTTNKVHPQPQWTSPPQTQAPAQPTPVPRPTPPPARPTPRPQPTRSQFIEYSGFWQRVVASLIDGIMVPIIAVLLIISVVIFLEIFNLANNLNPGYIIVSAFESNVFNIIINWLYFTLLESSKKQATFGKMAMGIVVTDLHGNRIGFGRANKRHWSKILSLIILGIGFLMVAFTRKKQGLHDMIAGTLIVKR